MANIHWYESTISYKEKDIFLATYHLGDVSSSDNITISTILVYL